MMQTSAVPFTRIFPKIEGQRQRQRQLQRQRQWPFRPPNPLKPISCSSFPTSGSVFSGKGKLVSRKKRNWRPNVMSESGTESEELIDTAAVVLLDQESAFRSPDHHTDADFHALMNGLSIWLVFASLGAVFVWRHDAEALWTAMGFVLNIILSLALKQIINQDRPKSALLSDPGMPSSHAQCIFFAVVLVIRSMVELLGLNGLTIILSVLAVAVGSYLSWLRVSTGYHTMSQVAVGAAVGSTFAILWFWTWDAIVLRAFNSHWWIQMFVLLGTVSLGVAFVIIIVLCSG